MGKLTDFFLGYLMYKQINLQAKFTQVLNGKRTNREMFAVNANIVPKQNLILFLLLIVIANTVFIYIPKKKLSYCYFDFRRKDAHFTHIEMLMFFLCLFKNVFAVFSFREKK